MERCTLAPGLSISRVITGLWQIADMERDGRAIDLDATAESMRPYVASGFTTFDMADHYGSAEDVVGRYDEGSSVQLLTKWVPAPGKVTRDDVRRAVERALKRMRRQRLDLLQFHAWSYLDPSWLDCLFWLDELRAEGLIAHLGVTNFDTAHLRIVLSCGIPVVSNQVSFSLLDQRAGGDMASLCLERGVKLLAFGTLAGGLLSERWLGSPEPQVMATWSQMKYNRFVTEAGGWAVLQELLQVLHAHAVRLGASIANVACRYILDHPAVGSVIVGARLGESEHIADNQRLFSVSLDDAAQREIAAALTTLRPIPGDCGDEYRRPPFLTASGDLSHHLRAFPLPYDVVEDGDRLRVYTGTMWEGVAGFSRAVREGERILVSGTTATHGRRAIAAHDVTAQTHYVIDKIGGALQSLGASLDDVVRTRVYVRRTEDWEAVARVHGQRFASVRPANTLVCADLIGDEYLVEMEAEAVVRS